MIDRERLIVNVAPIRKLNSTYYHYRCNRWRLHPRFRDDPAIPIDRPVFLVGTQGGGLTLLSRILHRCGAVVSVTGDHRYWAGGDETQNILQDILPEDLSWRRITVAGFDSDDHNWLYACDDFLPHYRRGPEHATAELSAQYRSIVRRIIRLNARATTSDHPRFVDKSQSLTVRVGFVHALLEDCRPKFVLITRNPFAMTWRAVTVDDVVSNLAKDDRAKLEVALQHWKNSMECALADAEQADLKAWRFEDLLARPDEVMAAICEHLEIPFDPAILPGPNDVVPWGSAYDAFNRRKWYPLRTDVNDRYLRRMPNWAAERVHTECAALLEQFDYALD